MPPIAITRAGSSRRQQAPLLGRADADPDAGLEVDRLVADLELGAAREQRVDLLLGVVLLRVDRVVLEVRREVHHREPERRHAEAGAHAPEPAPENGLEILEALDRVVSQSLSSLSTRPRPVRQAYPSGGSTP